MVVCVDMSATYVITLSLKDGENLCREDYVETAP